MAKVLIRPLLSNTFNSPLKNGLAAAHGRAADFTWLKNPVKSRGWPELVLANRELKKPGRLFQRAVKRMDS